MFIRVNYTALLSEPLNYVTCRSYLAIPSNSWVDDFIDWLNPGSKCCRLYTLGPNAGNFCSANEREIPHFLNTHSLL